MSNERQGKFVMTVTGDVKPLFMTNEQWGQVSKGLRNGTLSITTTEESYELCGVIEVARGYESKVLSASSEAFLMIFSKEG
ncbi:MAG: hypothetical protein RR603_07470 [Kurthia sp.]